MFSAICAASIASGRSPISRSGDIPNAGWPRSRNQTRLPQSGGVMRRQMRESSDLGSITIGAASASLDVVDVEREQRAGLPGALAADQQRSVLAVPGVDHDLGVVGPEHRVQVVGARLVRGHAVLLGVWKRAGSSGVGCGLVVVGRWRWPRVTPGGAGIRGIVIRRTGTPFIRAEGSASRCATSAADTRHRVDGTSGPSACGNRRRYRRWRTIIHRRCSRFSPRRDWTAAATVLHTSGLSAAMTVSSQNRLRFWVRSAARISARLNVDQQAALGQSPVFLAHELVLVAAVQAARELLEGRWGGGQLEADDRRRLQPRPGRGRSARAARTPAPPRRRSASTRSCVPCETASRTRARAARPPAGGGRGRGRVRACTSG